jgi:hypothetical protein
MSQKIPYLGDFELRVLQLVWENEPCMERQISDLVMKERPVARTTVLKCAGCFVVARNVTTPGQAGGIQIRCR